MIRVALVILAVLVVFAAISEGARGEGVSKEGRSELARNNAPARFGIREEPAREKMVAKPVSLGELMAFGPGARVEHPAAVVYLHGRHAKVENGCPWMRPGATSIGWLACPKGGEEDANDTRSWGADVLEQAAIVNDAVHALRVKGASKEAAVVVGFSQGSFVAADLLRARLVRFRGMVLLGANVRLDPKNLEERGVRRVVLGAGQEDATYAPAQEEVERLAAAGVEVRFLDLGAIGHSYMTPDREALREAIAWAGAR